MVTAVAWSPEGKSLTRASDDHSVRIWDASTGQCQSTLNSLTAVQSIAYSPACDMIVAGCAYGIHMLGTVTVGVKRSWTVDSVGGNFNCSVSSVAFAPDGSKIVVDFQSEIHFFDPQTKAKLGSPLTGHDNS